MKKLLVTLGLALSLAALPVSSFASGGNHDAKNFWGSVISWFQNNKEECGKWFCPPKKDPKPHPKPTPEAVPEIDAAGAGIALALLGGIVSIARERRKRQS